MIVLNPFPSTGYSLYSMALGLENSPPLSELYLINDKTAYAEVFFNDIKYKFAFGTVTISGVFLGK